MNKGNFLHNALALAGSSTLSQVIAVVASIVLAHLYSPNELGVYSNYIAILNIIVVITCLQYEKAIVISDNERDSHSLFELSFIIVLCVTVLTIVITSIFHNNIAVILKAPRLSGLILLLPISVFTAGTASLLLYKNISRSTLKIVAVTNLLSTLIATLSQIVLGIDRFHLFGGIIVGYIIGHGLSLIILAIKTFDSDDKLTFVSKEELKYSAKRYKRFPLFSVPSALLDTVAVSAPNLLLSSFFGESISGLYGLSYRVLSLPISVVGSSITQAFLPKATQSKKEGTLEGTAVSMINLLLKVGITPILLIAIVAPQLISVVFGDEWVVAGHYLRWICPWLLSGLLYAPLSNYFIVLEKQNYSMIFNAIVLVVRIGSLVAGGLLNSPITSIAICGVSGALVNLIGCSVIFKLIEVPQIRAYSVMIKRLIFSALYLIPVVVCYICNLSGLLIVLVAVICGCVFLFVEGKELLFVLKRSRSNGNG